MRVLVIGGGRLGAQVITQLRKNENIEIVVADAHKDPCTVKNGYIKAVDIPVHITPLNFKEIVEQVDPDLVLLARTTEDWEQTDVPMGTEYVMGMERELTKMEISVLPVSASILGTR
ncbi:MAG: hypothetical protein JW880_06280 [Candidatus Thermoplasmatota archaeon]|nr:hypothetical protein [Candidatus Thermoplasmatota archaeon]